VTDFDRGGVLPPAVSTVTNTGDEPEPVVELGQQIDPDDDEDDGLDLVVLPRG
jgi:hypothetical protein